MKPYLFKLFFLFFMCTISSAQQNTFRKHIVEKGENVYQIAKKYNVTPFDIYRLNPDTKEGIEINTVLLIPNEVISSTIDDGKVMHKVAAKETLFSIAKKYEVSVSDLKEWNEEALKDGLKFGQEIIVSMKYAPVNSGHIEVVSSTKTTTAFSHEVRMKETKFGIAKKYNLTIEQLEKMNPQIVEGLEIGQVLKIKEVNSEVTSMKSKNGIKEKEIIVSSTNGNSLTNIKPKLDDFYVVKVNETVYSISEKFNISQDELIKLNPEIKLGLREGMVLKIPTVVAGVQSNEKEVIVYDKKKQDLLSLVNKNVKRNLVLLLPFNLNKIETDSIKSQKDYLKDNKFLNLTLDFYSGAIMAIDSARALGLPVHVKILDVESSKSTSNVAQIIMKNDFSKVDAVIGPFMYSHVENTAQLLAKYKTPLISPLSKETGIIAENLYYSVPTKELMIKELFRYFENKNGNVVAIISGKKNSTKDHLTKNFPKVRYAFVHESGALDLDSLKINLVKGRKNFVILETEKAALILQTTKVLKKLKEDYDLQLVVLELYETLDFEEISMSSLTELNMLFPSTTKEPDSEATRLFDKEYKKQNNVNPNVYASKGFDLTFDTILRICQDGGFVESTNTTISEQSVNNFNYTKQADGKNINNGVYIMYYDNDYTIKQAQ